MSMGAKTEEHPKRAHFGCEMCKQCVFLFGFLFSDIPFLCPAEPSSLSSRGLAGLKATSKGRQPGLLLLHLRPPCLQPAPLAESMCRAINSDTSSTSVITATPANAKSYFISDKLSLLDGGRGWLACRSDWRLLCGRWQDSGYPLLLPICCLGLAVLMSPARYLVPGIYDPYIRAITSYECDT